VRRRLGRIEIVVLCTANQCRSPMAEVLLQARLAALGLDVSVSSAGELPGGVHASPGSVRAMQSRSLHLGDHRSQQVSAELLARADLVIGMGRRHLRHAVALRPEVFPRTFTLKELARRAEAVGPRRVGQSLTEWLAGVHAGRTTASLLGDDPRDDVADPIGGPQHLYESTADEISALVDQVVDLAFTGAERRETA
jgi:protein-tyrosine phosphatase